ncbi:MAG: hypothetical protein ACLQNE_43855 [Thermoguttaceae bacterium]|jgi:hypothetical protein
MKVLDAVESVLKEAGAQLNYEAITKQILEKGLWTAQGSHRRSQSRGRHTRRPDERRATGEAAGGK